MKHILLFEKYLESNEGVADTFLQTHHHFNPDFTDFEEKYKRLKSKEDNDTVIYNKKDFNGHFAIIKNPKSLTNIEKWARGIIDINGNLYVDQFNNHIHTDMVKVLSDLNLIEFSNHWHKEIPKTFVTVQRNDNTNNFNVGESNMPFYKDYGTDYTFDIKEYKETFQLFLNKAKTKNPQYNFINIPIDDDIKESIDDDNDFHTILNSTINKYMKNYNCTIEEINDGFCYDFAEEIQKRMKLPKKDLYILTTPMLSSDYSNQETEAIYKNEINWSKEMLNKYGKPPINMKFYHPDDHAWLVYKNKHYDAETPNGVNIWYELPIFQRYMKRKGFIKESINESKQVGILYHFTSYHNLTQILKSNTLKSFYPYIFHKKQIYESRCRCKNCY